MRELKRYQVVIAALQDTKWFGSATYQVGDSMIVLTSCQQSPQAGQSGQRGEGVTIVLTGPAIDTWKAGGELRLRHHETERPLSLP